MTGPLFAKVEAQGVKVVMPSEPTEGDRGPMAIFIAFFMGLPLLCGLCSLIGYLFGKLGG